MRRRRSGEGACGQAPARDCGGRRQGADSPAMLGLVACRITRYVRCAHCAQTDAASLMTKRAARAATRPALLGAADTRRRLPARAFAETRGASRAHHERLVSRQAVPGGGDVGSDEQRRAGIGAHAVRASSSDSPHLSERSERSERSELCGATPARAAQCSRRAAPTASAFASARHRLPRRSAPAHADEPT